MKRRIKQVAIVSVFAITLLVNALINGLVIPKMYFNHGVGTDRAIIAESVWDEEWIFRDDVVNILCLGIDRYEKLAEDELNGRSRGQADFVLLVSFDLVTNEIRVFSVPRDTMVDMWAYREMGYFVTKWNEQITLTFANLDGGEKSATAMAYQVSRILGGVPIHGYITIDLTCIPIVNDVLGGVWVTMDDDYTSLNEYFIEGEPVWLFGSLVTDFIQKRDTDQAGSAYTRLARQKLYLEALVQKVKEVIPTDMELPLRLYEELQSHIDTNLTTTELMMLVSMGLQSKFDGDDLYVLPGEIIMGEIYEEYYLDEEQMKTLIEQFFCGG